MNSDTSDDDLVRRVAKGDKAAFNDIAGRYRRRLMAVAARIAGPAASEDVVQETLIRAWVNAPLWKPGREYSYAAWLFRVVTNLSADQIRRRRIEENVDDYDVIADEQPDAVTNLIRREQMATLRCALARLPDRQRIAISLAYDAALSNAEAAKSMGISTGAFELLLVRARRTLRLAVKEDLAE